MADSSDQGTDDKVVGGPIKLACSTPTAVEEARAPASATADENVPAQPREEEKEGVEKQASEGKGDKSCSKLPDERRLWKFLEGVNGWRFTGSNWTVCGPEGGGGSGSSMEAAELPQYVVSHPSLLAEYEEWQQRQADGHEQEKPQESTRPEEKPQDKGTVAVVEEGKQTLPSEDREQAQEAGAPPTPAEKPSSVVDKSRTVKGSTVIGISPEATAEEKPAAVVDPAHTVKGSTQTSSSQGNASPDARAVGKKPAMVVDVARTVERSTETYSQGCVSPAEKPARSCAAEISPAAVGGAAAAATGGGAAALAAAPAITAAAAGAQRGASTTATVPQCSSPPKPSRSVLQEDVKGPEEGDMVGSDNGKETPHQGAAVEVEGETGVEEVEVVVEGKGEVQEAPEVNMEVDGEAGLKAAQGEKAVGGDVGHRVDASEKQSDDAEGPAGAAAAAAASGDVAGAGGGGAGAASKSKAKGDGKEGTAFGPCMCPRGTDGAHKTVDVERRCWPGSNKPGGVGRITKKYTVEEEVCGEKVQRSYFDIKYLLGGSEKKVQETYVSCTPLEIAARQSAPRDRFTVEVPEPTTRRQKPARTPPPPAPARTSPLASSLDANTSLSSLKAKAKGIGSLKKVSPAVKRSKPTAAAAAVAGGREGKGPRKRARTAEGGERAWKKATSQSECKENQEVHREREVPARSEEPTRHAITDLSVVVETTKTPSAPLSAGRMDAFQLALGALFRQSTTDTISLAKVHADINAQVVQGTSPFNDDEVTLSLKYLEDVESKVMLDSGMLYRI